MYDILLDDGYEIETERTLPCPGCKFPNRITADEFVRGLRCAECEAGLEF